MQRSNSERTYEFGEAVYPNGGEHQHPPGKGLQLAMILKGEIRIISEQGELTCGEGQVLCHHNNLARRAIFPQDQVTQAAWCSTLLSRDSFGSDWEKNDPPRIVDATPLLTMAFSQGLQLLADQSFTSIELCNALGEAAFREYFHHIHLQDRRQAIPYPVLKAKDHLDRFYREPCSLEDLSKITSLSPPYLVRIFKQHLGTTPSRYLWKLRGDHAMRLLKHSGLSIKEIAYSCGFQNPYHFSHYIRRHYGGAPSTFRNR